MSVKIYHNPRCKKSRAGLEHLKTKTEDIEIIPYLKNGLSKENVRDILLRIKIPPVELIRTQEDYYKKFLKGKSFTEEEWIKILNENPKLLKRPVVIKEYKAVIGDPPENIDSLF